jgi:hypothetical protein
MFQKAVRKNVKLKLAITGPSGSGKTYSALRLAAGMSKKVCVIDSENKSASLYADKFNFDVCEIMPPFTVEKYIESIDAAEKAGYEVIVLDSISQMWAGEGGLLEQKEAIDARGGNSFSNWRVITKQHEKFKSAMLQSTCHLIATMRSKQDYAMQSDDKGKVAPKKLGLAPIQRAELEYEYTIVFDIAMDHNAKTSKDRTDLFRDEIFQVTEATGEKILKWLSSAAQPIEIKECVLCKKQLIFNKKNNIFHCPDKKKQADGKDDGHTVVM